MDEGDIEEEEGDVGDVGGLHVGPVMLFLFLALDDGTSSSPPPPPLLLLLLPSTSMYIGNFVLISMSAHLRVVVRPWYSTQGHRDEFALSHHAECVSLARYFGTGNPNEKAL